MYVIGRASEASDKLLLEVNEKEMIAIDTKSLDRFNGIFHTGILARNLGRVR